MTFHPSATLKDITINLMIRSTAFSADIFKLSKRGRASEKASTVAWKNWETFGHEEVMRHLVSKSDALPGMARPDEAARFLANRMLTLTGDSPGLHVFVTHDSLITPTVARLQGAHHGPSDWP